MALSMQEWAALIAAGLILLFNLWRVTITLVQQKRAEILPAKQGK